MRFTLRLLHQFLSFQKFISATVALAGMIEVREHLPLPRMEPL